MAAMTARRPLSMMASVFFALFWAGGCTHVPVAELGAYRSQFDTARDTAEDMILSTKTAAQELADDPDTAGTVSEKGETLRKRLEALDERLKALQVIAQYNDALTKLAQNEDPAAIRASLDGFTSTLASFDIKKLTGAVEKFVPYADVASAAIALIDRLIRQQRFRKAVEAGEKPVLMILEVLAADAENIFTIREQRIMLVADQKRLAVIDQGWRFKGTADRHRFAAPLEAEFQDRLRRQNALRTSFKALGKEADQLPALDHVPASGASDGSATVLDTLTTINEMTAPLLDEYNALVAGVGAQRKLIDEYKNVLASTGSALVQVRAAMEAGRRTAVMSFIADVYRLRQAYLAAREAKAK